MKNSRKITLVLESIDPDELPEILEKTSSDMGSIVSTVNPNEISIVAKLEDNEPIDTSYNPDEQLEAKVVDEVSEALDNANSPPNTDQAEPKASPSNEKAKTAFEEFVKISKKEGIRFAIKTVAKAAKDYITDLPWTG